MLHISTSKSLLVIACVLTFVHRPLRAEDKLPVLITKLNPNEGKSKVGVVFDTAEVELTVDETGVPFSLQSSIGLPEYIVKTLEKWRYSPYIKKGRAKAFAIRVRIPVARPLTPFVERNLGLVWLPGTETTEAIARGRALTEATADVLEANLPDAEVLGNPRTSLLVYYAEQGSKNVEKSRVARAKYLAWLIGHYPQDDVLGSSFAIVNGAGDDPMADPAASKMLTQLWLDAVKSQPDDVKTILHALNFLRVANPMRAMLLLAASYNKKNESTLWAGSIYGLGAIGVSALSPATGKPIDATDPSGERGAFAITAREKLLESEDAKVVLSSLRTVTFGGRSLAASKHLPSIFGDVCAKLLLHAKGIYPQTTQTCDTAAQTDDQDEIVAPTAVNEKVLQAKLIQKVQPRYPSEAKTRRVQGTLKFQVGD